MAEMNREGKLEITKNIVKISVDENKMRVHRGDDVHYDTISAFIKSVRGSDENAAIYYLARMLKKGEDIEFIGRRLVILASEDIGLADPNALVIANAGLEAVKKIGMPEARIILAEVTIYLAKAKKSNSAYNAINEALRDMEIEDIINAEIPGYLKQTTNKQEKQNYKYPHNYEGGYVEQEYLPKKMKNRRYYNDKWGNDERNYKK